MPIEIERKFLVVERTSPLPADRVRIVQGYMTAEPPVVRVRISGERGFLSVKTPKLPKGTRLQGLAAEVARAEYEYEIPLRDAEEMINLCSWRIAKTRHYHPGGFEHDVFEDQLAGLEVIEYESHDIDAVPPPPPGIVWRDVTGDPRFSNIKLALGQLPLDLPSLLAKVTL